MILDWLSKILPFLGNILNGKIAVDNEAARIKAQVELEEAKAFKRGQYAPRYVLKYCLIAIFCVFCMLLMIGMFFPYAVDLNHPVETIERLAKVLFSVGWE